MSKRSRGRTKRPAFQRSAFPTPALQTSRRRGEATEATLLHLAGQIYDATLDAELWPVFLKQYADAMGANRAAIQARSADASRFDFMSAFEIDPAALGSYECYYALREPWVPQPFPYPAGSVKTSAMLVPDRELEHSEFYSDFLRPLGIHHICTVIALNENTEHAFVSVFRPKRKDDFGISERKLAQRLYPHLRRAVQISLRLTALDGERVAALDALESLSAGVILLERTGRIALMNREARRIAGRNDGVTVDGADLKADRSDETGILQKLIADARAGEAGQSMTSGGVMAISRPSGKRPYSILVAPTRMTRFDEMTAARPAVAVFITDPEKVAEPPADVLMRLYGLTPAEARLAEAMAGGGPLTGAAERLGIGRETARSQLKQVFAKTGTRRQAELVRLLLTSPAALTR